MNDFLKYFTAIVLVLIIVAEYFFQVQSKTLATVFLVVNIVGIIYIFAFYLAVAIVILHSSSYGGVAVLFGMLAWLGVLILHVVVIYDNVMFFF